MWELRPGRTYLASDGLLFFKPNHRVPPSVALNCCCKSSYAESHNNHSNSSGIGERNRFCSEKASCHIVLNNVTSISSVGSKDTSICAVVPICRWRISLASFYVRCRPMLDEDHMRTRQHQLDQRPRLGKVICKGMTSGPWPRVHGRPRLPTPPNENLQGVFKQRIDKARSL